MNYRHAFHAGNFGDVLKHVVLLELLDALHRKPNPVHLIDSHAGIGMGIGIRISLRIGNAMPNASRMPNTPPDAPTTGPG